MRRSSRRPHGDERMHEDRGAALIMAIGFMVAVGGLCAGLSTLITSTMHNRTPLETSRNRQFSADGAIEYAIAQIRADTRAPLLACNDAGATIVPADEGSLGMPVLNKIPIQVDWDNACGPVRGSDGVVVVQRNVIFSACLASAPVCRQTDAVIIRAQVNFEDPTRASGRTFIQTWSVNG